MHNAHLTGCEQMMKNYLPIIVPVPVGADGRVGCVGSGLGRTGLMHNAHLTGCEQMMKNYLLSGEAAHARLLALMR